MEQNYGNRMPPIDEPDFTYKVKLLCRECGGLNRHLRSCSKYVCDDQCEYCRAPSGFPHHIDCPEE